MIDATTLNALNEFPQRLEAHYAAIPEEFRHWAPPSWKGVPSEPFTAIEQICHVRDIEIDGYHERFRRTLHELNPTLPSVEGEKLARERAYATSDAAEAFARFRIARAQTLELISGMSPEQLARPAIFEGHPSSLRGLVPLPVQPRPTTSRGIAVAAWQDRRASRLTSHWTCT